MTCGRQSRRGAFSGHHSSGTTMALKMFAATKILSVKTNRLLGQEQRESRDTKFLPVAVVSVVWHAAFSDMVFRCNSSRWTCSQSSMAVSSRSHCSPAEVKFCAGQKVLSDAQLHHLKFHGIAPRCRLPTLRPFFLVWELSHPTISNWRVQLRLNGRRSPSLALTDLYLFLFIFIYFLT